MKVNETIIYMQTQMSGSFVTTIIVKLCIMHITKSSTLHMKTKEGPININVIIYLKNNFILHIAFTNLKL